MKILLPVDGSIATEHMLTYIAAHDELRRAGHDYVAFTAVNAVPAYVARLLDRGKLDAYYGTQANKVLEPVQKFARQNGWNVRPVHAAGHPSEAIASFVELEKPDLIVMGTHGHSALANMLLGSVASGVLARCRVPLLLVP